MQQYQQVFVPVQPMRRPKTLSEKIDDVKADIKYETKFIKIVGLLFLSLGSMGIFSGIHDSFSSRQEAAFMREFGQMPWGNPNYTNWTVSNSTRAQADRVEMALFDVARDSHLLKSFVSLILVILGMQALRSVKRAKGSVAQKMFQRYFITWCAYCGFYCYMKHTATSLNYLVNTIATGGFDPTIYGGNSGMERPSMNPYHFPVNADPAPVYPWPALIPQVPGQISLWFATIVLMVMLKYFEKSQATLEFLQKAKKIVKYTVKQQIAQAPITAAPEPVKIFKICKKLAKVEPAQPVQPIVVMPVVEKAVNIIQDVESALSTSGPDLFDYAIEETSESIMTEPPMTLQSATISTNNSMI